MNKDFLSNVYGYNKIKDELSVIRNWYFEKDETKVNKISLPKGIIFYGEPGYGKTHIVREYSKSFNYPIFVVEGKDDNVDKEVIDIYKKAKSENNAIVVIDEIDRLIEKDSKLIRIIMAELDGFDSRASVLTLATCNDYDDLPEALVREGRFDRHFYIGNTNDDIDEIIKHLALDSGLSLQEDEVTELSMLFRYTRISQIKSTFNNVRLRYGNNYNIDNIISTRDHLRTGYFDDNEFPIERYIAIHEAGHALYTHLFCKTKKFLRVYFNSYGGCTVCNDIDKIDTKESRIECIYVGLAGLVAEDIIFKEHNVGCGDDLGKVYNIALRLINRTCINGIDSLCPREALYDRTTISDALSREIDARTKKFINTSYKIVKKRLIKYKKELNLIGDYIQRKRSIKSDELIKIIA